MKPSWWLGVAFGLVSSGLFFPVPSALAGPEPDVKATAQTLVHQSAGIKQGDLVLITGTARDTALLEEIAVTCRKVGAFPLISIGSERLGRRMIEEVPAKFDTQTDELGLKLAGIITARISVESTENEAVFAGIAPERLAAREKSFAPIMEATLKRNVRQVGLGNGLFPTESTATLYGLTKDKLTTIFWDAVNTDYSKLQNTGESVKTKLASGKEVRITNPNGTDLKFGIASRPIFVSDGVISPDDAAKGGPACQVWLPAGEVYAAPAAGTAEGKVVIDRYFFQGKEITGLTLTIKDAKVTEMTAKSGLEPLKALYDASGAGKEIFGFVDIGINQSMSIPAGSKLLAWMPAGMVTIGIGNNTWAGGTNDTSFSLSGFLPGSTLTVDGTILVERGTLKP